MRKGKGKDSWVKVGTVTAIVCCFLGVVYGIWATNEEEQARYKRAMEFSFAKKYASTRTEPMLPILAPRSLMPVSPIGDEGAARFGIPSTCPKVDRGGK